MSTGSSPMDAAVSSFSADDAETMPAPSHGCDPEIDSALAFLDDTGNCETSTAEKPSLAAEAPPRDHASLFEVAHTPETSMPSAPMLPAPAAQPPPPPAPPPPPVLPAHTLPPAHTIPYARTVHAHRPDSPPAKETAPDAGLGRKAQRYSAAKDASVCQRCKGGGRNLVVCIDGTSNQFSKKNTNVVELYSRLVKSNDEQLTFYNSGIGTYARPSWRSFSYLKQVIANKLDLAFALRFDKIILSSYTWLADNYIEGDRIFLFGFSRGAYQVRTLSAMIDKMGLIHKGNADQIPFAYELYSNEDVEDISPEGKYGVLVQVVLWTLSNLTVIQCLWCAWRAKGGSTIVNQMSIWIALTLALLHCLGAVRHSVQRAVPVTTDTARKLPVKQPDTASVNASNGDSHKEETHSDAGRPISPMQQRFKQAFARDVRVHFVGAWDTVSSVGLVRDKTLPGTTDGMPHVCYFRHALALHERRVKFLPEFVYGGLGPSGFPGQVDYLEEIRDSLLDAIHEIALGHSGPCTRDSLSAVAMVLAHMLNAGLDYLFPNPRSPTAPGRRSPESESPDSPRPRIKEVWFPGSHSDIGGGASPNEDMRQFGPALRWMSFEARLAGLKISNEPLLWDMQLQKTRSFSLFWHLLELLPVKRLSYDSAPGTTYRLHLWSKRRFQPGQLVYGGVSSKTRNRLCRTGLKVEKDPYLGAEDFLRRLQQYLTTSKILTEDDRIRLETLSNSVLGQQQLQFMHQDVSNDLQNRIALCDNDPKDAHFTLVSAIQRSIYGLEYSFDAMMNSRPLYDLLGLPAVRAAFPGPICLHTRSIRSLVCLTDEKRVISCDWRSWIERWHMSTGRMDGWMEKSIGVWAVSQDGKYGVAESLRVGMAIRVLDSGAVYAALHDPPSHPYCTVFAPDGRRAACGSIDGITLWDIHGVDGDSTATATTTVFSRGRDIMALAFSSKSDYLVAGGPDSLIEIWDLRGTAVSKGRLAGHRDLIHSVAFSPDGTRIVSGSNDATVRIWSSHTLATLHVIAGHSSFVQAVAFSPCGRYVVSGSHDLSVRIWDAETGRPIGVPLNGHSSPIYCITFSPDGARIISGSEDGSIRIWDRMPAVPFVSNNILRVPVQPLAVPAPGPGAEPAAVLTMVEVTVVPATDGTGDVPAQPARPDGAHAHGIEDERATVESHAPAAPGVTGSEGDPFAGAALRAYLGPTSTRMERADAGAEESQSPAEATKTEGTDAEADELVSSRERELSGSASDRHSPDRHESSEERTARAAAGAEDGEASAEDGGHDEEKGATAAFRDSPSEELSAGGCDTAAKPDEPGVSQDPDPLGLEVSSSGDQPATWGAPVQDTHSPDASGSPTGCGTCDTVGP